MSDRAADRITIPRRKQRREGLPPLESTILRGIREAFAAMPDVVVWRSNTGMLPRADGEKMQVGLCVGASDLVGIVRVRAASVLVERQVGRFFALEVKQPGKVPTPAQNAFLCLVRDMGGAAAWVDSVNGARDFIDAVREWRV